MRDTIIRRISELSIDRADIIMDLSSDKPMMSNHAVMLVETDHRLDELRELLRINDKLDAAHKAIEDELG